MIKKPDKKCIFFFTILSCIYSNPAELVTRYPVDCSLKPYNVNVLLVTNNGDDATNPATLRGALAVAQPGDVINFALPGGSEEILLNEENGPLVVSVPLIIDGSNTAGSGVQVTVNGQNEINIGFLVESSAPSTTIQNITIKNLSGNGTDPGSGTESQELFACGILINGLHCFIDDCTIENILSGANQSAAGICSNVSTCPIVNNTITNIQSASSIGTISIANSGDVFGIFVDGDIQGSCSNNTISMLATGDADANSGNIAGIAATGLIQGDCVHNSLMLFNSGLAVLSTGDILGITCGLVVGDVSCNTMKFFETSGGSETGESGDIVGVAVEKTIVENCSYNTFQEFVTGNANNESGDIRGVFVLDGIQGDFSHNNYDNLSTGSSGNESGLIKGLSTSLVGGSTSYNTVTLFTTGDAVSISGNISGLESTKFELDMLHNVINQFVTGSAASSGSIEGITSSVTASEIGGTVAYNTLSQFTTGISSELAGFSGHIKGIKIGIIGGRVHDNLLELFSSGNTTVGTSDSTSGSINGIEIISYLRGDMVNNIVRQLVVSEVATAVGWVQGILVQTINTDRLVACNIVDTLLGNSPDGSETSNSSFGIAIQQGDKITICHNTITNLTGLDGSPIYGLLLGDDPSDSSVANSTIGDNIISNIMGGNQNGFGIIIVDENSLGNKLFNNLIFDINGKAIVILDPLADTTDKTVMLTSVQCTSSGKLIINGTFSPDPSFVGDQFLLQFFVSNSNVPPQAMMLIGEQTVTAQGMPISFVVELKPCPPTESGQYITATATALVDPNNNTTELSNAIEACESVNPLCAIIMNNCMAPPPPEVCPISLTGAPPVPAPCPPVVVPPCPGTELGSGTGN